LQPAAAEVRLAIAAAMHASVLHDSDSLLGCRLVRAVTWCTTTTAQAPMTFQRSLKTTCLSSRHALCKSPFLA